jgi:hypothetical protein
MNGYLVLQHPVAYLWAGLRCAKPGSGQPFQGAHLPVLAITAHNPDIGHYAIRGRRAAMTSFIEVNTTAGMQELVNVAAIQSVKQMKKCTQLVFTDEEPLDVIEKYEEVKDLIKKAAVGEAVASK